MLATAAVAEFVACVCSCVYWISLDLIPKDKATVAILLQTSGCILAFEWKKREKLKFTTFSQMIDIEEVDMPDYMCGVEIKKTIEQNRKHTHTHCAQSIHFFVIVLHGFHLCGTLRICIFRDWGEVMRRCASAFSHSMLPYIIS